MSHSENPYKATTTHTAPARGIWLFAVPIFMGCAWLSLSASLLGGLMLLGILDDVGLSAFADHPVGSAVGFLGFPILLLLLGVVAAIRARRLGRYRDVAIGAASGIVVGSACALAFLLAGGWGAMFG